MRRRIIYTLIITAVLAALIALGNGLVKVEAAPDQQEPTPDPNLSISDEVCLGCHGQPGQTMQLQDGSQLELYVPGTAFDQSIHGKQGYACVQCHRNVGNYPHPPFQAADLRDVTLQINNTCQFCHTQQFELTNDSVHARALEFGTREAAVCVDCHTAHDVRQLTDPQTHELLPESRVWIPQTCARCHFAIYEKYKDSVHGSALIGEGNPDVPTCIDCHGVHNIQDPTTASFRLSSPEMCGKCHSDSTVVGKYGLSTDVFNTYVTDFHGTTVELFEKQHSNEQTNKPVCYDCHGIHDIARTDDPQKGLQIRQNLLIRCQECHPNATENFPSAWMSHYIPSPEKNPMVYYVNLFYKFFIPGVLGSMAVLVALDFSRMSFNRLRVMRWPLRKVQPATPVEEPPVVQTVAESETQPEPAQISELPQAGNAEAVITETEEIVEVEEIVEEEEVEKTEAPEENINQPQADETPTSDGDVIAPDE